MKFLKYFESDNYSFYGLTPEDLKFMFVDLEDLGWSVDIRFTKKLHQLDFNTEFSEGDLKLGLQPSIEVIIRHSNPYGKNYSQISIELFELINSTNFKETIEVANQRLKEYKWKIRGFYKEDDYIKILLSKSNI